MKNIKHKYSWILMKTFEIMKNRRENEEGLLTKVFIPELLSVLEYQTWFWVDAKTLRVNPMIQYANVFI